MKVLSRWKGRCQEIFDFRFFLESSSPEPPISYWLYFDFSKVLEDISQFKVHHRHGINDAHGHIFL